MRKKMCWKENGRTWTIVMDGDVIKSISLVDSWESLDKNEDLRLAVRELDAHPELTWTSRDDIALGEYLYKNGKAKFGDFYSLASMQEGVRYFFEEELVSDSMVYWELSHNRIFCIRVDGIQMEYINECEFSIEKAIDKLIDEADCLIQYGDEDGLYKEVESL